MGQFLGRGALPAEWCQVKVAFRIGREDDPDQFAATSRAAAVAFPIVHGPHEAHLALRQHNIAGLRYCLSVTGLEALMPPPFGLRTPAGAAVVTTTTAGPLLPQNGI